MRPRQPRHILLFAALAAGLASPALAQRVIPPWNDAIDSSRTKVRGAARDAVMNPAFKPIREGEFVRRIGSTLMLGDRPFRFNGNNTYYLQAEIAYRRMAAVEETLDKMADLGMTVTRANAHNDHLISQDPATIQTAPGVFNEANLVALDQSIAESKKRNIRMIMKLTNNWEAYGGIRRYVAWHLGRNPVAAEYPLFYTTDTIKQWFKNYVRVILERRNTVTGTLYKDEPAILAWELGNELRNPSPGNADALIAWMTEMSAFIKSVDSNHLVADGGEGFDDSPALYPGLSNTYPVNGREGCSYHRMVEIPDIDMASYHLYPSSWGLNDNNDVTIWIKRHEEIARAANKVAYFGEYGKRANNQNPASCSAEPGRAFDPQRADIFNRWLTTNAIEQGSAGHMAWQMIDDGRRDCEGFQIHCPDHSVTCDLLRRFSAIANADPLVVTSGANFNQGWLAPDAFGSLFSSGLTDRQEAASALPLPVQLAGAKVVVVDSRGAERDAQLTYAGPSQINFLVPPASANGGAVVRVLNGAEIKKTGTLSVVPVEPGLFSADATGSGVAAAVVTLARPDGTRTTQLAARYDSATARYVAIPVDLSAGDAVISLYGTGWRNAGGGSAVEATIGGIAAPVLFAGAQPEFPGLDQINLTIPRALAGRGAVDVAVKVSGRTANTVRIEVR